MDCRSKPSISCGSITLRSLRPFDCSMRMLCLVDMLDLEPRDLARPQSAAITEGEQNALKSLHPECANALNRFAI
jgi:hypothetical protein